MAKTNLTALMNLRADYTSLSRDMDAIGGRFYITSCEHRRSHKEPGSDALVHMCVHGKRSIHPPASSFIINKKCHIKECPL